MNLRKSLADHALPVLATLVALGVAVAWIGHGAALAGYPYDWDPGEGLSLDYARRMFTAPQLLYPKANVVPYPLVYTPLYPLLLAVPVAWFPHPLAAARVLGIAFGLLSAGAVFLLVRRKVSAPLALLCGALVLAPFAHSFWYVVARVDGLLIALWLWAAVVVLPEPGTTLTPRRAWLGAALLVLAVLTKPTAAIFGAPLVLGWWFQDRRSMWRLAGYSTLLGVGSFVLLQWLTGGGFWNCLALQLFHAPVPGQTTRILVRALTRHGAVTAAVVLGAALALRGKRSIADAGWLLFLAGPLSVPLLAKSGAIFNYLLPWAAGQAVLAGRLFQGREKLGMAALSLVTVGLAVSQSFPLPTDEDARTAEDFHAYVAHRGAPILAANPDYASFLIGQPVEIEGASFSHLLNNRAPGIEVIEDRLRAAEYHLLAVPPSVQIEMPEYVTVARCTLGFFFGRRPYSLLVPRRTRTSFKAQPGSRCLSLRDLVERRDRDDFDVLRE